MTPTRPTMLASALLAAALMPGCTDTGVPVPAAAVMRAGNASSPLQVARLPLAFERNQGQTDVTVQYLARGPGYALFLTPTQAVFTLHEAPRATAPGQAGAQADHHAGERAPTAPGRTAVVRMVLDGANAQAVAHGLQPQGGLSHYYRGRAARADVARVGQVRYRQVYDGVDVVYYGNQHELEYDFVVAPGKDPAQIALAFEGANATRIDAAGNLVLSTDVGELTQRRPVAYQRIDGRRVAVEASYRRVGDRLAFALGRYDRSRELVIDPVLSYSTYLGGSGDEVAVAVETDAQGNSYVLGYTNSLDFPRNGAVQATFAGGDYDVFVSKVNAAGNALVYSTYLGGSRTDMPYDLQVDAAGNAWLVGYTDSVSDFPLAHPMQPYLYGTRNAFIARLGTTGQLAYSTYYGVNHVEARSLAFTSDGGIVIGGVTQGGLEFPGAWRATPAGQSDGFLMKLDAAGTRVQWGTYIGSSDNDGVTQVVPGDAGSVHVAGFYYNHDFPSVAPLLESYSQFGAFFGKFSATGQPLHLTRSDQGAGALAADTVGNVYVAHSGSAYSPSYDMHCRATVGSEMHVAKYDTVKRARVHSSDFGTSLSISTLELGPDGSLYVGGNTWGGGEFPTTASWARQGQAALARIRPDGRSLEWASFLGGVDDPVTDIALAPDGKLHAVGRTFTSVPTVGALQSTRSGTRDAYLARVSASTRVSARARRADFDDDGVSDQYWRDPAVLDTRRDDQGYCYSGGLAAEWTAVGTGDFDGDHRADIFWRHGQTGQNQIWFSGNRVLAQTVSTVSLAEWKVAAIADFNGDDRADVLWRHASTGRNEMWYGGTSAGRAVLSAVSSLEWIVAGAGDFDGDRKADILWRNTRTGANDLWRGAQSGSRVPLAAVADVRWRVAGVGDFNGDGRSDILWRHSVTGGNELWRSASPQQRQVLGAVTNVHVRPVGTGDYNGDGRDDILWRNESPMPNPYYGNTEIWFGAVTRSPVSSTSQSAVLVQ